MKIKYLFLILGTLYSGSEVLAKCHFTQKVYPHKCSRCGSYEKHGKCGYWCMGGCKGANNKVTWDPAKTVQIVIEDGKLVAKEV